MLHGTSGSKRGSKITRDDFIQHLTVLQYSLCGRAIERTTFHVHGDVFDIYPFNSESKAICAVLFDDKVETLQCLKPRTGKLLGDIEQDLALRQLYK